MKKSRFAIASLSLFLCLTLSGCNVDINQENFLEKLFPNPYDALAIFLAFIVLLVVVFFVAYKPIKELIKKRGDYVENKIKNANQLENEAERKINTVNEEIKSKKLEAINIIEKAKSDAKVEKENILENARLEKDLEVKKTKLEISQEIEASKDEIHREIVSVAIDASEKLLSREINSNDNKKLIDDFIDNLKEDK